MYICLVILITSCIKLYTDFNRSNRTLHTTFSFCIISGPTKLTFLSFCHTCIRIKLHTYIHSFIHSFIHFGIPWRNVLQNLLAQNQGRYCQLATTCLWSRYFWYTFILFTKVSHLFLNLSLLILQNYWELKLFALFRRQFLNITVIVWRNVSYDASLISSRLSKMFIHSVPFVFYC